MNTNDVDKSNTSEDQWQFWIDRGGTFTDVVARDPRGVISTHKLLSDNPQLYKDPALQGIRNILGIESGAPLPTSDLSVIKIGTTVATNALLERTGDPTLFVTTEGFADALQIGYQSRPKLFALNIDLPELLYGQVIEAEERINSKGDILVPLDIEAIEKDLSIAFRGGFRSMAVVLMHGYRYPKHEKLIGNIAKQIGFKQISLSHRVSPRMKLIPRGETTLVDAYLSPVLNRYIDSVASEILTAKSKVKLYFMQSNGGLTDAKLFNGKDAVLSGPAGGVIGGVKTSMMAGFDKIIGFDMGGTSTDVWHYDGTFERLFETEVAGIRISTPMLSIHTVAAGGGSVLHFDGTKYRVGPDSAGANPGPACYGNNGPLTVTDCNLMLGKLNPCFFPQVLGPNANSRLDVKATKSKFVVLSEAISSAIGHKKTPEEVAEGFLSVAIENMANAIKKVSIQRGYDVSSYTLCCFGGAGGQHACRVADSLGMTRIFIHGHAGVLSAYGIGMADITAMRELAIELPFKNSYLRSLDSTFKTLESSLRQELLAQLVPNERISFMRRLLIRYQGTDSPLEIEWGTYKQMAQNFESLHYQRYGYISAEKPLIVESIVVEGRETSITLASPNISENLSGRVNDDLPRLGTGVMFSEGCYREVPLIDREELQPGDRLDGPAIIVEANGTNIVEPGWQATMKTAENLILNRIAARISRAPVKTAVDPMMLELFNNVFMSVAEHMGVVLQNTSHSINIKERLDFSCAVFDSQGGLVANAPHVPVHLGAMDESIRTVLRECGALMRPGDMYMLNTPYNGGTHLPDITVITPVFDDSDEQILFFVGSRAHHAEIGGISPGSIPPYSNHIEQEGVLIDNFKIMAEGKFREKALRDLLATGPWPSRDPETNIADLKAQIAANESGIKELHNSIKEFGQQAVKAYMGHIQDNAEEMIKRAIHTLQNGDFTYQQDNGSQVSVSIRIHHSTRTAKIDFSGTSLQLSDNFNAPSSVVKAAVLYVFRTLISEDIPLNGGCLKPLEIIIPKGSMLSPEYPSAVVAGNVETSQVITDTLYGALGIMAASQGTMNNFTFGSETWQYYETICGGAGAGPGFDGASCVQTHMTNTRLTDPEVLEWRYPVMVDKFHIRRGSGGLGEYRGGDGACRRIRFLEPMAAAIVSGHRKIPPYGMAGGQPGECGTTWLERTNGTIINLASCDQIKVDPGDVFVINTPSGGGYGEVMKDLSK